MAELHFYSSIPQNPVLCCKQGFLETWHPKPLPSTHFMNAQQDRKIELVVHSRPEC